MGFFKKHLSIRGLIVFFSLLSVALLAIHHWIFHENGYWANFLLLHEIALMPLEFVVVTLGLEKIMELTHKRENQAKISMIESVFFSESGSDMLRYLVSCDADGDVLLLRSVMDVQPGSLGVRAGKLIGQREGEILRASVLRDELKRLVSE